MDSAAEQTSASRPRVTAVILNFNSWRDTLRCLASLDRLEGVALDVLVVDNGSHDDSVAQIRAATPDVELVETGRNLGFAGGCNFGTGLVLERDARYVWLLNNDAFPEPDALRKMVDLAEAEPDIGAVGSVLLEEQPVGQVQAWGGGMASLWYGHVRNIYGPDERLSYLTGASLLIRREAIDQVGLLDEHYFFQWEDVDYSLRLRKAGWQIAVPPGARVVHRGSGSSPQYGPFRMEHHASGLVLTLRKHARLPWLSALPILGYYAALSLRHRNVGILRTAVRGWMRGWRIPLHEDPVA